MGEVVAQELVEWFGHLDGTLSKVVVTVPSGWRAAWSWRMRQMRESGWANSSMNSPAMRVYRRIVLSCSRVST
ncbi:hypothetical protein ABZ894_25995 [Nocardia beijingensis]|uniref:hypothetical protein n=1 Tax=Nocardia beijingensis TaxID=95162 RepID=UPI0033D938A1